jgi:hypothetical protein
MFPSPPEIIPSDPGNSYGQVKKTHPIFLYTSLIIHKLKRAGKTSDLPLSIIVVLYLKGKGAQ